MKNPSMREALAWQQGTYGTAVKTKGVASHSPCPLCGTGDDRLRIRPKDDGSAGIFCSQCGPDINGLQEICKMIAGGEYEPVEYTPPPPTPIVDRMKMDRAWEHAEPIPGCLDGYGIEHPANLWAMSFGAFPEVWLDSMRYLEGQPVGYKCDGRILAQYGYEGCDKGFTGLQEIPIYADGRPGMGRYKVKYPNFEGATISGSFCLVRSHPDAQGICVTEGVKDAIALSYLKDMHGGTDNVIALGSATSSPNAVRAVRKAASGLMVQICMDNDDAGKNAAQKLSRALKASFSHPPDVKDWADYLQKHHG